MNFLYIDPGSGSLLFQIIVAGIISFLFFFKRIWNRIAFWKKKKPKIDE
jgi:hypothetical protein